jgi:putative membrane-bound dehydrogenase-like protein
MRAFRQFLLFALILWGASYSVAAAEEVPPLPRVDPLSPDKAAASFRIRDGFELQLLAAEPLVTDPVDMQYDEFGRAYVVEMCDYPYTDKASDKPFVERTQDAPLGRVRLLEDRDGDGKFDRSTLFAEGLSWPTGIALYKGGAFVVATPDLWWFKDTNDDGVADERRVVYTGFRKFNVQAVVNNLEWGLDHRLYAAGSSNGGTIRRGDDPQSPSVVLPTADFRFSPDDPSGPIELLSGGARFGNCFDDAGNRFICNIRNPVQHILLPKNYLARNADAPARTGVIDVAEAGDQIAVFRASPPEPWRELNSQRLAFDPTLAAPRSEAVATGYMTSACGLTIYRGDAYPPDLRGSAFLAEPSANLIHHQTMERRGPTFTSKRSLDRHEFVASTDNWFRPVNFVHAPDGTLHVLDMYRETIEHPWSIPDDIKARLDLESGRDRGRIYRLAPTGFRHRATPRLGDASTRELVETLAHPNAWHRDTAHRLLFERQDSSAIEPLRSVLRGSDSPLARLHALWSLAGMKALTDSELLPALGDPSHAVRRSAVELLGARLAHSAEARHRLVQAASDSDPAVRLHVAFALGTWPASEPVEVPAKALATIAIHDAEDESIRAAIWSSLARGLPEFIDAYFSMRREDAEDDVLLAELAQLVGRNRDPVALQSLLRSIAFVKRDPDLLGLAAGLGEGLNRKGLSLSKVLADDPSPEARRLAGTLENALATIGNSTVPVNVRRRAVALAAHGEPSRAREALLPLLNASSDAETQSLAVNTLGKITGGDTPKILLDIYATLRPEARAEVVEALLSRAAWHTPLVAALEAGVVQPMDVPYARRNTLLRSGDADLKQRAVKLFSEALEQRKAVFERYRASLRTAKTDPTRGEVVFRRECQTCHKLNGQGRDVGPNLATIRNRAADEILLHVLDPNREVAPNFVAYTVVTTSGRTQSGLVQSEDASRVVILLATGATEEFARADIDELAPTNQSLMPVGLETRITPDEMADLISFLLK